MKQIDIPAQKEILWHRLRTDLKSLVPRFDNDDLLLCPTCCRPLGFDEFSVEHIVPKQALRCDPANVRQAIPQNERSGLTLLCQKPLVIKGKRVPGHGCNSWKGKHFDPSLRELLGADFQKARINTRHQVSLYSAGYLALFRQFGYQISLSPAGLLSRRQFFFPNTFLPDVPLNCQMILAGERRSEFNEDEKAYWCEPFNIKIDDQTALVVLRNMGFRVPISRDPTQPLARILPYLPSKFKFRPDLTTVFE
ncbi:hypothetical protein QTA58_19605 [Neorhizobium sp. CSC1952]|uniref:hypothetical protein n=1 Tax=Neorhizobium sp. CSC1952 TaxID=2978974 RepID=UPI0025A50B6D|nr:hypothetical protein [Rhizobium sp. CSC1952]WJR66400.1 hypothetical protein QTA58_19605 [Rhizobium sp. CSC1952]